MEWADAFPAVTGLVGVVVGIVASSWFQSKLEDRRQEAAQRAELRVALAGSARALALAIRTCNRIRRLWGAGGAWEDPEVQKAERDRRAAELGVADEREGLGILVKSDAEVFGAFSDALEALRQYRHFLHEWKRNPGLALRGEVAAEGRRQHTAAREARTAFVSAAYRAAGLDQLVLPIAPSSEDENEDDDDT